MQRRNVISAVAILLLCAIPSRSEDDKPCTVWGSVYGVYTIPDLNVELTGPTDVPPQKTRIDAHNHFEFDAVPPGSYRVNVLLQSGEVIVQAEVPITGKGDPVYLQIWQRSSPDTVSLQHLSRKVPDAARKAYVEARTRDKISLESAIQLLEKAVRIAPGFAEAENYLGALYGGEGRYVIAADHFQKAFDADDSFREAGYNLARTLLVIDRYSEAEAVLRHMIRTDRNPGDLRILLATTLIIRGIGTAEALNILDEYGEAAPMGRLMAAELFRRNKHYAEAADQLAKYLKSDDVHRCDRTRLQAVLVTLRAAAESNNRTSATAAEKQAGALQ